MTQARDTGELVNDVGTAASADVQTSTTDVTVGRVVINGGHGLGGDGVAVDWNAPTASILAESSLNSPIGGTSVLGVNVKSGTTQSAFVGRNERFFGRTIEAGVVQPWHELYTGANLSPNVFGGGGSTIRILGVGSAVSATLGIIYLPIMSLSLPSSISVTGTFSLRTTSGSIIKTGIPASDISLGTAASTRYANILVANLSGLSIGTTYELRNESIDGEIEVNF